MISPKTLRFHQFHTLFHLRYTSLFYPQIPKQLTQTTSIFSRNISLSTLFQHDFATQEANEKSKKPLEAFFTEAIEDGEEEKKKLKKNLELELRRYKKDPTKETTKTLETFFTEAVGLSENGQNSDNQESENGLKKLSNLFTSTDQRPKSRKESKKAEESMEFKELTVDMADFAKYLHRKGYLINANFLPNNEFDVSCFVNNYGRDFLKFAAQKFAKDNREIYKWLPKGDLKKVAQSGCPSLDRKNVFSAKAMRFCFGIPEETVCNKCTLKDSCKFVNQSVWKKGAKNVDLTVVMRVITLYALDAVPAKLEVPDNVKNAVNGLLKEVVRLSEIES